MNTQQEQRDAWEAFLFNPELDKDMDSMDLAKLNDFTYAAGKWDECAVGVFAPVEVQKLCAEHSVRCRKAYVEGSRDEWKRLTREGPPYFKAGNDFEAAMTELHFAFHDTVDLEYDQDAVVIALTGVREAWNFVKALAKGDQS